LFLGGSFTALFWSLVIIAGLVVPALLETLEFRWGLKSSIVAPLLLLVGGLSLRWILVLAGQA
jgi:formate-dependent nitrite reductase membrane component NrfD